MKIDNFMERLFPVKYDFYKMLIEQTEITHVGIKEAQNYLESKNDSYYYSLCSNVVIVDRVRLEMEEKLVEAFVTPFDRQDIYSVSVEMDKIIEFVKSGLEAQIYLEVEPDQIMIRMVCHLKDGLFNMLEAMKNLKLSPLKSEEYIEKIRECQKGVEDSYRDGIIDLYKTNDSMKALKFREVYHYMKDAAIFLGYTVDKLHKIVVRVV